MIGTKRKNFDDNIDANIDLDIDTDANVNILSLIDKHAFELWYQEKKEESIIYLKNNENIFVSQPFIYFAMQVRLLHFSIMMYVSTKDMKYKNEFKYNINNIDIFWKIDFMKYYIMLHDKNIVETFWQNIYSTLGIYDILHNKKKEAFDNFNKSMNIAQSLHKDTQIEAIQKVLERLSL